MGPLKGIRIVEMVGIGPAPHCCMLLSDMGAEIIRIDRPGGNRVGGTNRAAVLNRGRKSIAIDIKTPEGVATALRLIDQADGLVEGFRWPWLLGTTSTISRCPGRWPRLAIRSADRFRR
jgi:alpha-methylacyl-CoA racemase